MRERPTWALPSGLPSRHTAEAAIHVAATVDARGSRIDDAEESYWHRATGGRHPPADLAMGQALLVDLGLLIEDGEVLRPTAELNELLSGTAEDALADIVGRAIAATPLDRIDKQAIIASIPDSDRREQLLLQLALRHDDQERAAVGAAGERLVVAEARAELQRLARADLAREVRQVSLISDQLGYDVRAPCLQGPPRRLEVKATVQPLDTSLADVFLTRNEARVGACLGEWKLVLCHITDVDQALGSIVGWWSYDILAPRVPLDVDGGIWQQAKITLAIGDARPGLPSAVL